MELLIIGGTRFLGRALAAAALARGHRLTLFNRGRTNPQLFPQARHIIGDRDGDLSALADHSWDAVIDTCGYIPRVVRASAQFLADKVARYIFISTISVYAQDDGVNKDEGAPLATIADETIETVTSETYGPLKVLCESAVEQAMPNRALIIRPGLIVGPYDPTNRFTYWVVRIARGGEILAPGGPHYPTQFIDVRDLAEWIIAMAEARANGIYNATGPDFRLTLGALFALCQKVAQSQARFTWIDDATLIEAGLDPFMSLPLWIPADATESFHTIRIDKALRNGLRFRPLEQTIADTLAWHNSGDDLPIAPPAGLDPDREAQLLAAWHGRNGRNYPD